MRKVVFATGYTAGAVAASTNYISLYDPLSGTFLANNIAVPVTSYPELILGYKRDGQILNTSIFPRNMTYSYGDRVDPVAPVVTITPTNTTLIAGETYTLVLSVAGHPNDNRYTKRASIIATDNSGNGSNTMTLTAALDAFVTAVEALGNSASASTGEIMGVEFTAANSGGTALVITNASGSEDNQIVVSLADSMVDHAASIAYTQYTAGLTAAAIQQLEADADSEWGQRNQVTSGFNTTLDGLATGYTSACTDLCVLKYRKPADQVLGTESNLEQELFLFYDGDATAGINTLSDLIEWLTGAHTQMAD